MAQEDPYSVQFSATKGINPLLAIVKAIGENRTSGWVTSLEQAPIRIHPPHAQLLNEKPSGFVTQVITPFETNELHLPVTKEQTHVTVHMPEGTTIDVEIT